MVWNKWKINRFRCPNTLHFRITTSEAGMVHCLKNGLSFRAVFVPASFPWTYSGPIMT